MGWHCCFHSLLIHDGYTSIAIDTVHTKSVAIMLVGNGLANISSKSFIHTPYIPQRCTSISKHESCALHHPLPSGSAQLTLLRPTPDVGITVSLTPADSALRPLSWNQTGQYILPPGGMSAVKVQYLVPALKDLMTSAFTLAVTPNAPPSPPPRPPGALNNTTGGSVNGTTDNSTTTSTTAALTMTLDVPGLYSRGADLSTLSNVLGAGATAQVCLMPSWLIYRYSIHWMRL